MTDSRVRPSHPLRVALRAAYRPGPALTLACQAHAGPLEQRVLAGWRQWQLETAAAQQAHVAIADAEQVLAQITAQQDALASWLDQCTDYPPLTQALEAVAYHHTERDHQIALAKQAQDAFLRDWDQASGLVPPLGALVSRYAHSPRIHRGSGWLLRRLLGVFGVGALADRMRQEHLAELAHDHLGQRAHYALTEAQGQVLRARRTHPRACLLATQHQHATQALQGAQATWREREHLARSAHMRLREALMDVWQQPPFLQAVRAGLQSAPLEAPLEVASADPPALDAPAWQIGAWCIDHFLGQADHPDARHLWRVVAGRAHLSIIPGWEWVALEE